MDKKLIAYLLVCSDIKDIFYNIYIHSRKPRYNFHQHKGYIPRQARPSVKGGAHYFAIFDRPLNYRIKKEGQSKEEDEGLKKV